MKGFPVVPVVMRCAHSEAKHPRTYVPIWENLFTTSICEETRRNFRWIFNREHIRTNRDIPNKGAMSTEESDYLIVEKPGITLKYFVARPAKDICVDARGEYLYEASEHLRSALDVPRRSWMLKTFAFASRVQTTFYKTHHCLRHFTLLFVPGQKFISSVGKQPIVIRFPKRFLLSFTIMESFRMVWSLLNLIWRRVTSYAFMWYTNSFPDSAGQDAHLTATLTSRLTNRLAGTGQQLTVAGMDRVGDRATSIRYAFSPMLERKRKREYWTHK